MKLHSLAAAMACVLLVIGGASAASASSPGPACNRAELAQTELGSFYYMPAYREPDLTDGPHRCRLSQGASGPAVRAMQDIMVKCYAKHVTIDGVFGPVTTKALRDVQHTEHIIVDGVYGPQSAGALSIPYYDKADLNSAYICSGAASAH